MEVFSLLIKGMFNNHSKL